MYFRLAESIKKNKKDQISSLRLPFVPQKSAVLLLLFEKDHEDHVVLTKRSQTVAHHKGQICFPGGVFDEGDQSLWQTALRETEEEIGIQPQEISFIGEMGKIITPTGFEITPYVGLWQSLSPWTPNPGEIAEIFSAPLSHLFDPLYFKLQTKDYQGIEYQDPHFYYKDHIIWGATGRILVELRQAWKDSLLS